jgi:hypothetical protein
MVKTRYLIAVPAVLALTACQTIGKLTVRDYTAANGEHVMIGQAAPDSAYQCTPITREKEAWGLTGNMDEAAATERMREVALEKMPEKHANYGYLIKPSNTSVMGFNVNAFDDAQIAYYRCDALPSPR